MKQAKVAVIGAGISGLVSAWKLQREDKCVTLYEPGKLGGVLQTRISRGFTLETGPNVFAAKKDFLAFLDGIDLTPEIVWPALDRYKQYVWFNGKPNPVPRTLSGFISTSLIASIDKLRLPFRIARKPRLDRAFDDQSISDFFEPLLGQHAVRALLDPALQGIFGGSIDRLSARSVFPSIWRSRDAGYSIWQFMRRRPKGDKRRAFLLRGGNQRLVERLRECVASTVVVDNAVTAVEFNTENDGLRSCKWKVFDASGSVADFDRVVVATSGVATAGFIGSLAPELSERLKRFTAVPLVVVHCGVPTEELSCSDGFGMLFPSASDARILGVMYNSVLFPHVAPSGQELLTVCLGGFKDPGVIDLSECELLEIVQTELKRFLGIRSIDFIGVKRWPRAIPQYELGHHHLVEEMHSVERENEGIRFVGADIGGVGVPDRVAQALSV